MDGFIVEHILFPNNKHYYYIYIKNHSRDDQSTANVLGMTHDNYKELVSIYGGKLQRHQCYFTYEKDALKFAQYLSEKYLIILKLQGKI